MLGLGLYYFRWVVSGSFRCSEERNSISSMAGMTLRTWSLTTSFLDEEVEAPQHLVRRWVGWRQFSLGYCFVSALQGSGARAQDRFFELWPLRDPFVGCNAANSRTGWPGGKVVHTAALLRVSLTKARHRWKVVQVKPLQLVHAGELCSGHSGPFL